MAETDIEWTRGSDGTPGKSWNPTRGCSRCSPGCGGAAHEGGCYAERQAYRFSGPGMPYEGLVTLGKHGPRWTGKVVLVPEMLGEPLRWRKPTRIFVDSMSDLFHESLRNEDIAAVFGIMAACPQHTFIVLTKRAERMAEWFEWVRAEAMKFALTEDRAAPWWTVLFCASKVPPVKRPKIDRSDFPGAPWPLPNVWLGVSVESQRYADERIPHLMATPAVVRFISAEPLLGRIDLTFRVTPPPEAAGFKEGETMPAFGGIDWIIVGGESGPGSRDCDVEHVRHLVKEGERTSTPVFVKQLGKMPRLSDPRPPTDEELAEHKSKMSRPRRRVFSKLTSVTTYLRLKHPKGGNPAEWPEDMRVRQFPI